MFFGGTSDVYATYTVGSNGMLKKIKTNAIA